MIDRESLQSREKFDDLMRLPVSLHCGIGSGIMIDGFQHVAEASSQGRFKEYQPVVLKLENRLSKCSVQCCFGLFGQLEGGDLGLKLNRATLLPHSKELSSQ